MLRILIADDHRLLRAGLRSLLRDEPDLEVVGEAADGDETLVQSARLRPDIVLADISMPGPSGIEVARQLRHTQPSTRVLILTMHEDGGLLQEAIRAGAYGFIIKRAAETELITALREVALGRVYVNIDMQRHLAESPRPAAAMGRTGFALSDRERELLRLIARGRTHQEIAAALGLAADAVEHEYADLTNKLGVHGRVGLVRFAREQGLV